MNFLIILTKHLIETVSSKH